MPTGSGNILNRHCQRHPGDGYISVKIEMVESESATEAVDETAVRASCSGDGGGARTRGWDHQTGCFWNGGKEREYARILVPEGL